MSHNDRHLAQPSERRALGWAALLGAGGVTYVVAPVALGILMGTMLAFMARPLFGALHRRFGVSIPSTLAVVWATIAVTSAIVGLAWLLASRGTVPMSELLDALVDRRGRWGPKSPR